MGLGNALSQVDQSISGLFGQWNVFSTLIATALIGLLTYAIWSQQDADIHPMLLTRQAQASPVRNEGESPVYRSQGAPHGMPLNPGLNVKEPGASRWSRGRDGDLRDIWRQAVAGVQEEGPQKGAVGRILTVHGSHNVQEHGIADVTRQINLIGQHIHDQGGHRVAIYLPNSVELVATLFACAFYNMTAIILPFDQPADAVISMLRRSAADTVVTVPGSFPFDHVVQSYPSLRQLIWVVDEGNKHMDWNEVPQGTGSSVNVATWQDIVNDQPVEAGKTLPPLEGQNEARDVTVFWLSKPGTVEEMVRFTSGNFASAIAAQLFAVPTSQRMGPSDLFLPADSLANTHTLVLTLAALYSNASLVFNSAAAQAPDLFIATRGVAPTVVVATPAALLRTHDDITHSALGGFFARQWHRLSTRSLTQSGIMPTVALLTRLHDGRRDAIGTTPGKLRLIYTAERAGAETPVLSSTTLSDLRVYTGARIIYALTAAKVAGAVTQTAYYDYRVFADDVRGRCHLGVPVTSVEVMLKDAAGHKNTDERYSGEVIARGPSVAGGEAALGVTGVIRDDNTLALT